MIVILHGQTQDLPIFKPGLIKPDAQANKIAIIDRRSLSNILFSAAISVDSNQFLSGGILDKIEGFVKVQPVASRPYLVYQWVDNDNKLLGEPRSFKFYGEADGDVVPPNPPPAGTATKLSLSNMDDKNKIRVKMMEEIETKAKTFQAENYTALIFDENLHLFYQSRPYGVAGDLIFVGIFFTDLIGPTIEFSPCSLEPESPLLYVGDTSVLGLLQSKGPGFKTYVFPPRRCFNSSVSIKIKALKPDPSQKAEPSLIEGNFPLSQYNRYRGTLQMGVLFTDQHEVAFGLRTANDKKYIYNKGPVNNGPEYTASLVIYSIFRYVENLFSTKKHFSGRDIVNDRSFIDLLGAVIGVGLTNPVNRFVLGLSYEVAYGINLIGVVEFARHNQLGAGLAEGAEYSGTEDTIPIHQYWANKFVVGLSLDLRYVTALFSKR